MRFGYLVLPKDLVATFCEIRGAGDAFSSTLYQLVMNDFIREGHLARHIRKMRVLYRERRRTLIEAIQRYLGDQLEVIGAEAVLQLTALLRPGVNDLEVTRRATLKGISVRPLSACYLNPPARGGVILGYGNVDTDAIRAGVLKLAETLQEIEPEPPRLLRRRVRR
jgi:GntR family transcriptional regulator/MocR family aminotransferase